MHNMDAHKLMDGDFFVRHLQCKRGPAIHSGICKIICKKIATSYASRGVFSLHHLKNEFEQNLSCTLMIGKGS